MLVTRAAEDEVPQQDVSERIEVRPLPILCRSAERKGLQVILRCHPDIPEVLVEACELAA
jgi:hypothetical protein